MKKYLIYRAGGHVAAPTVEARTTLSGVRMELIAQRTHSNAPQPGDIVKICRYEAPAPAKNLKTQRKK